MPMPLAMVCQKNIAYCQYFSKYMYMLLEHTVANIKVETNAKEGTCVEYFTRQNMKEV